MPSKLPAPSPAGLVEIYQCLCDETRLRILNLLLRGPLCVCHIQEVVALPQAKISKHLAYLKSRRLVQAQRHQAWVIYALPAKPSPELEMNLKCLQDCAQTHPIFKGDLRRLAALAPDLCWLREAAPDVNVTSARTKNTAESCCS